MQSKSISWKSEDIGNPSWKTNEIKKSEAEATEADEVIE
jgi:hypothetical protein